VRILARGLFASILLAFLPALTACGGGNSSSSSTTAGPLSGNWQLTLAQQYPTPITLSASGFLVQSSAALTGSVEGPILLNAQGSTVNCSGTAQLTGTVNSPNVSFTENLGGTIFNFTGSVASDNQSMSGDYEVLAGGCSTQPTTGSWNAILIPSLTGSFTGTLMHSQYMLALTGSSSAPPIPVTGTITQSDNAGASNATLTGTINAVGYPCLATASLSGTISGQNVYMDVFSYNGQQIGTVGVPSGEATGSGAAPAVVTVTAGAVSLVGTGSGGLTLGFGAFDPCPPILDSTEGDTANVTLNF